ncbi:putative T7SS-secreted protein [Streptomyces sp. NPDC005963]|uniref:putative T7SS-secreted protein n=1 Tax=Streptomyces sp. NPDC005963 TaxID=3156721 RepID=UPI0033D047B4
MGLDDWGKALDGLGSAYDKVRDGIDKGKEIVGEGVDAATDAGADLLDKVGAEGAADSFEDWGDRKASSLGAQVDEAQLGQTDEANELIHGNAGRINGAAKNLRDFQTAFDSVGQGLKRLDSQQWKGEAADTFREKFSVLPVDWLRAADAFGAAAKALGSYAEVVTWAQGKAREAIALHKEGNNTSNTAIETYNKKAEAYNVARNGPDLLPKPDTFVDPGESQRERAREMLAEARRQRNDAAEMAKSAVAGALAHAPAEPKGVERLKLDAIDTGIAQITELQHVGSGVIKGTAGILNFVRAVNPIDPYNLTHPAEYYKGTSTVLAGLVSTAANPDRALKNLWETAKNDPGEFVGRLLPELIGTKGAGVVRGGIRAGAKTGTDSVARQSVDDPAKPSRTRNAVESGHTDPIDLATGVMFLPQTDIALPGLLPLVFGRRVASDYQAGRWFGPQWASTADQRLEIDSQGVVLVCEDGLLQAYPHPAPGVPVLPSHGPRRALEIDQGGDYTVTEHGTGQVHHFTTRGYAHLATSERELALLTRIEDRNGNWIDFEYDENGAPASIVHHGGYHLKLATDQGRISSLSLASAAAGGADQQILRYGYTDGLLTEVTNSSGLPLRFAYDASGRVMSWTDTNGSRYDYAYDDDDRCVAEGGVAGHMAVRLAYGTADPGTGLRTTTLTSRNGAVRRYQVNTAHQIVAETDPLGAVTRYERDRYNRLLSRTDPLGLTTRFTYDDEGNPVRVVRPDGRELLAEYGELGLPVRVVGPDRTTVRREYDERGNCIRVAGHSGSTLFVYDDTGRLTSVTDGLGHLTRIRCDPAGLPLEIVDPLGAVSRIERDGFGRPVALIDALGTVTRLEWTPEGRPARRIEADGSEQSWTYDGEGNCVCHTDALGAQTRFEYTHFDLMSSRTGPDGARYEFTHDTELRLTQVLNPQGLSWDYAYDPAGRLTSETDFDGRTLDYEHDAAGRLTARIDALGQLVRYERDTLDRIVAKDADGAVTTYGYDLFDQLAEASGPDARISMLRDRFGRLRSETVDGRTTSYAYDELGRRVSRTTPSGAVSTWTYDAAGRRNTLTASGRTLTFERDAVGREVTRGIGETLALTNSYDLVGRLTSQQVMSAGRSVQRRGYSYRADGHVIGVDDQLTGVRAFSLDVVGRVTAVNAEGWTESYAYDEAGNQRHASWPLNHPGQEAVGPRTYSGTTITRAGKVRYEHDARGRITLRQKPRSSRKPDTWRYTWDAEDHLTSVVTPDGSCWRYRYDPLGRRIAKQRLGQNDTILEQVDFTWDGAILCEQTTTAEDLPNPVTLTWDHDGVRPLTQTERITSAEAPQSEIDQRFFSIVTDLVGTPTELIDESGDLAWHTRSTLWGTTTWSTTSTAYTPLRFPGQYFDPETGLHYNFHRHYDPETGRYLSSDPLGLAPAPNPVAYVRNPHLWSDPLGLAPYPPNLALGIREHNLREFAAKNEFAHYLDDLDWESSVRGAAHNPDVHLHIAIDGFFGETPTEKIMAAYKSGSGDNWFATEREIYHVGKAIRVGDREWDSITFYEDGVKVKIPEMEFPKPQEGEGVKR